MNTVQLPFHIVALISGFRRGCVASLRSGFLLRPHLRLFYEASKQVSDHMSFSFFLLFVHDCSLDHLVQFGFFFCIFFTAFVPRMCLFFLSGPYSVPFCGDFSPLYLWLRDVSRIVRNLTFVTPCWQLPSGLCSSVPFFALPSFSLFGHGTFQDCCFFENFRQSSPFRRRERGRMGNSVHAWSLSRKRPWLRMVPVNHHCIHLCHHHQQEVGV